jgi:hypothetical protein
MTPDDLTSRAHGEAEDAARKFVHERHPQWHDVGVGIVQGSHYRAGFAAGAKWWEQNRPVAVPRHGEALTADYNQGPRDALTAARISPDAVRLADAALALAASSALSQDDTTKLLRTAQSAITFMATSENAEAERDTLTARLDRLRAGVSRALAIGLHERPAEAGDVLSRALLAEDET